MSGADLDESTPSCSGACHGGRLPCPTPQACEVSDQGIHRGAVLLLVYLAIVAVLLLIVAVGWSLASRAGLLPRAVSSTPVVMTHNVGGNRLAPTQEQR